MNLTPKQLETIANNKITGSIVVSIGISRHADVVAHYLENDYKSFSAVIQKAIDDLLDNNPNRILNEIHTDVRDLLRRVNSGGIVTTQKEIEPEIELGFDDTAGFSEV